MYKADLHIHTEYSYDCRSPLADIVRRCQEIGIDCGALTDPEQQRQCNQVIDNMVAQNTYGTATTLGGFNRLRGLPQGRYQGAHTLFFGTEFR